jgi:hypothetical protein
MNVNPIKNSLNGEHLVDVSPPMQPDANLGWQRRLNLYSGRSLSDRALITEQQGRSGILATRGQLLSPGVITGLEVDLEQPDLTHYQIAAGTGITANGEDVLIPRTLRVGVKDVRVYASAAILDSTAPTPTPTGILTPRKLGKTLGELITNGIAATLPRVGILVLQPIVAELVGRNDPRDSCETDPQNDAFEDWQIVDGCRLVLYPWASEWLALPESGDLTQPAALGRWRNRLAYTIFSAEKANTPDQLLPWEMVGVPIALVGFDADWKPLFSDRYSVVRSGGLPKRRHPLVANAGSPFLWQARVQQFAEQLSDLDLATVSISQVADQFLYLPPVGVLPTSAIEVRSSNLGLGQNHFFPSSYKIQAAPVPLEQLDIVLESSASLVPFDLSKADQVQILAPVPQAWYEPDLLKTEAVDSEFQRTIDQFVNRRSQWLNRRSIVQTRNTLMIQAITGTVPDYADPDRLEDELAQPPAPFTSTRAHQSNLAAGLHQHYFDGATAGLAVASGDRLTTYLYLDADHPPREVMVQWNVGGSWEHRAFWGENLFNLGTTGTASRQSMGALPASAAWVRLEIPASLVGLENTTVTGVSFTLYDGRAAWGHTGKSAAGALPANDTVWVGDTLPAGATPRTNNDTWTWIQGAELLTPFEEDFATTIEDNVRVIISLRSLSTQLTTQLPTEASQLSTLGLEPFIALLETKVKQANDRIDFHFLRVQTDIYRIRQFVLGTDQAARLATSPTLAAIAEGGQSARVTQEQLNTYFTRIKSSKSVLASPAIAAPFTIMAASTATFATAPQKAAVFEPLLTQTTFTNFGGINSAAFELKQTQDAQARLNVIQQTDVNKELFVSKPFTQVFTDDVLEQSPLIGAASRTVTVAERLQPSASVEARNFTLGNRADTIENLANLGIDLGEVSIPGTTAKFKDVNAALLNQIRLGDATASDESAQFSDGVKVLDNTVAALRLAEGRVQDYRSAIATCQNVLTQLRGVVGQVNQRLGAIAAYLAEARHDVAVVRALLAEEQLRINGINQRRDAILQQYVTFLVFYRPRFTEVILDAPTRPLDPGITSSPIPVCFNRQIAVPSALRSLVETLRDAPVNWFTHIPRLIDRLDRFETIYTTLQSAKRRASLRSYGTDAMTFTSTANQLGKRIQQTVTTQQTFMVAARSQIAQLNLSVYSALTWTQLRDQSTAILSLGDLIDGGHGRSDVSQQAAQELDQISHVAACLYASFGEVLPVIRLEWAERLSQYDAPVNLRNLASLPRWGEIDLLERRDIQTMVDWLYQQIDALQPNAVALISDLVRVCILLASHAPVNQIISGRLSKPTIVNLGSRVELAIDPATVRVGMQVLLYSALNRVVAQGVVEDLASGQASARIVHAYEPNVPLTADTRVQFAELGAFNTLMARS